MAGIFDALKIIREQLPKFTTEMGVPFLGKDKPSSVMDATDPNAEKRMLETILGAAATIPAIGKLGKVALANPFKTGAATTVATGDPTNLIGNPILALAASPGDAQAAFVTPRPGASILRKFADATLEHLPNPKNINLDDISSVTLGELYSTSKEGRDILNAVPGLRSASVTMNDKLPPNSRGRFLWNPASGNPEIHINPFPLAGEYKPAETLTHEVQHVIDALQKRVSGTSPTESGKKAADLIAKDVEANILPDGTIEKKTLNDILDQSEVDVYLRNAGENRARIDAGQYPQFENFATWFEDALTGEFKTGR